MGVTIFLRKHQKVKMFKLDLYAANVVQEIPAPKIHIPWCHFFLFQPLASPGDEACLFVITKNSNKSNLLRLLLIPVFIQILYLERKVIIWGV
jgi:hypothetical protein